MYFVNESHIRDGFIFSNDVFVYVLLCMLYEHKISLHPLEGHK